MRNCIEGTDPAALELFAQIKLPVCLRAHRTSLELQQFTDVKELCIHGLLEISVYGVSVFPFDSRECQRCDPVREHVRTRLFQWCPTIG